MKQIIPVPMRLHLRVLQRHLSDRAYRLPLVPFHPLSPDQQATFFPQISLTQALLTTQYSHNKKHNLALAIQRIQHVLIAPGKLFSFWHLVGQPCASKGYVEGRSLINQELKAEIGGGLCQLSGILYFLALKAGLAIVERYPHSRDIYTDATRFTPLGSDATVVYGYKDFRFHNSLATPICFRFHLSDDQFTASLCAPVTITEFDIEFVTEAIATGVQVHTWRSNQPRSEIVRLTTTTYQR